MTKTRGPLRKIAVGAETEPETLMTYLSQRHRTRTTLVASATGDILEVEDVWGRPCERYRLLKLSSGVCWQRVA